jgi:isoquinoline 1-oxidoreductase beta subunit
VSDDAIRGRVRDGLSAADGLVAKAEGDLTAALRDAARTVEADYEVPFVAHAAMEPFNCTIRIADGVVEAWGPFQIQDRQRETIARAAGVEPDRVLLHTTMAGGAYGRRFDDRDLPGAVAVALRVGRPVKLFWRREEELGQGGYRPAQMARLRAGLDASGRVVALGVRTSGTSIMHDFAGPGGPALDFTNVQVISDVRYRPGAYLAEYVKRQEPVPSMFWRAVGATQNGFFLECFIDEVAASAGRDPVDLRRELLAHDARALRVVEEAAARAGWGEPLPEGRARGFAFVESYGSLCAQVVEASLAGSRPRVHRVTCVLDCGSLVMPDGALSQIEGGIVQALSVAVGEKVTIEDGRAVETNFDAYAVLRMDEASFAIDAHVIESGFPWAASVSPPCRRPPRRWPTPCRG